MKTRSAISKKVFAAMPVAIAMSSFSPGLAFAMNVDKAPPIVLETTELVIDALDARYFERDLSVGNRLLHLWEKQRATISALGTPIVTIDGEAYDQPKLDHEWMVSVLERAGLEAIRTLTLPALSERLTFWDPDTMWSREKDAKLLEILVRGLLEVQGKLPSLNGVIRGKLAEVESARFITSQLERDDELKIELSAKAGKIRHDFAQSVSTVAEAWEEENEGPTGVESLDDPSGKRGEEQQKRRKKKEEAQEKALKVAEEAFEILEKREEMERRSLERVARVTRRNNELAKRIDVAQRSLLGEPLENAKARWRDTAFAIRNTYRSSGNAESPKTWKRHLFVLQGDLNRRAEKLAATTFRELHKKLEERTPDNKTRALNLSPTRSSAKIIPFERNGRKPSRDGHTPKKR